MIPNQKEELIKKCLVMRGELASIIAELKKMIQSDNIKEQHRKGKDLLYQAALKEIEKLREQLNSKEVKKQMRIEDFVVYFFIIVIGFAFAMLLYAGLDNKNSIDKIKQSCGDIGMEYYHTMGTQFCVDSFGNANYAKFSCDGTLWDKKCTAQIISIGDVRVR